MLHGENHCVGFGRLQMLHIITYYLSYIIAIQFALYLKNAVINLSDFNYTTSNYASYSNILRFSLQNGNSTLGENVRYLMHKYDIVNSDWIQNIDILYSKVEVYINRLMYINHKCTGSVIRELCETRDSCNTHFLSPMNCFI